jgi:hypothetical protein
VTKLIFATNIYSVDGCWGKFLDAGNFSRVVPIAHQGRKESRIILLEQVFDITSKVNFPTYVQGAILLIFGMVLWAQ